MPVVLAPPAPAPWKVWSALAAVYVVWGSTYIAILFALGTLPPFLMAGARFLIAGTIIYAWARARGAPRPEPGHWRGSAIVGALLLLCGNGGVVWGETRVESGIAAVLVSMSPIWMALFEWVVYGGARPGGRTLLGLAAGLGGVVLLVATGGKGGRAGVDPLGAAVLVGASLAWSFGSIYSRRARLPASTPLATGMQMLAGGAMLLVLAAVDGEFGRFDPAAVSLRSALAIVYLVIFGSIVGFSAYLWLLRVTTTARVSTYAYVNPVVAVLLGWAFAGEALAPRTLVAMSIIVASVAIILTQRKPSTPLLSDTEAGTPKTKEPPGGAVASASPPRSAIPLDPSTE